MTCRLLAIFALLLPVTYLFAAEPTFVGEWETTYGRMSLKADAADGAKLSGTYRVAGEAVNTLTGKVEGRTFIFTYVEPGVNGEGSFTLAEDGSTFDGKWRPGGSEGWGTWSGRRQAVVAQDFSGVWSTDYGFMRLVQKGDSIEGCYSFDGHATLSGSVKDGVFSFTYREPDSTTGKGSFQLAADRASFSGTWTADAPGSGGAWKGKRVEPQPGRTWLIVLEAHWEPNLRDAEYSYGDMLRAFFARVPTISVRHRYFTGRADFARWCADLTYLTEPAVLYISSHGTAEGITAGAEVLDGAFIGEQLRLAPEIKLIHLGACLAMSGNVPAEIRKASALPAPISGYTLTADWAGSAVLDFAYLDLVLARKMDPGQAVQQLRDNITFSLESTKPGSAIAPAGLKILP